MIYGLEISEVIATQKLPSENKTSPVCTYWESWKKQLTNTIFFPIMQRYCMRQRRFLPFKTLWAVSGIPIAGIILLWLILLCQITRYFCILSYLIYNAERLISFWRDECVLLRGKSSFLALPQVAEGETFSLKPVKSHMSELSSSPGTSKDDGEPSLPYLLVYFIYLDC